MGGSKQIDYKYVCLFSNVGLIYPGSLVKLFYYSNNCQKRKVLAL